MVKIIGVPKKLFNSVMLPKTTQALSGIESLGNTMRTNLPKRLDQLIFCIYSLNFSLEFFIMIFFASNQLNISKFSKDVKP